MTEWLADRLPSTDLDPDGNTKVIAHPVIHSLPEVTSVGLLLSYEPSASVPHFIRNILLDLRTYKFSKFRERPVAWSKERRS